MEAVSSAAHLDENVVASDSSPTSVEASIQVAKRRTFKKDARARNKANKRKLASLQKNVRAKSVYSFVLKRSAECCSSRGNANRRISKRYAYRIGYACYDYCDNVFIK